MSMRTETEIRKELAEAVRWKAELEGRLEKAHNSESGTRVLELQVAIAELEGKIKTLEWVLA
jgi:hypothetical protein